MLQGRCVGICWRGAVAETVRLFVLPPLLTFALIAFTLLLFTSHLAQRDLQTTFVVESRELASAGPALAAPSPR